jgi:heme-degrading monooxygenase HmoA/GNAT superfamily N-acetyltransferase
MILEHALLPVQPGREADFEATFARAREIISASPGFGRLTLSRCLERPSTYLLLVEWDRLEDHTEGFRGSSAYQEWSRLLHPFYDPFPTVEHYEAVDHGPLPAPEVRLVVEASDSARAAALLADFVASIKERYPAFDPAVGPSARPEDFTPPQGAFFVAEMDGTAVGCCGVKAIGPGVVEIKRLWVAPAGRGLGVGRRLLQACEDHAVATGATLARLDTGRLQAEALSLFASAGYVAIDDYNGNPFADHWFEHRLTAG